MPRASVEDGVELYYADLGDGPPVVLVHGGCMSHRVWESQIAALFDTGYRVVVPDLRRHGESDKPSGPYAVAAHAGDLGVLFEALDADERQVVGWSLGAILAATAVGDYGERVDRLVLVSSSIFERLGAVESSVTF